MSTIFILFEELCGGRQEACDILNEETGLKLNPDSWYEMIMKRRNLNYRAVDFILRIAAPYAIITSRPGAIRLYDPRVVDHLPPRTPVRVVSGE